jgi:hypothetical protein
MTRTLACVRLLWQLSHRFMIKQTTTQLWSRPEVVSKARYERIN